MDSLNESKMPENQDGVADETTGEFIPQANSPVTKQKSARGGRRLRLIGVIAAVILLGGGYFAWSSYEAYYPSTDDAYVGAPVIRIAPEITGTVQKVGAASFSHVRKGDLLVQIDPRPFKAEVDRAEAAVTQARQQLQTLDASLAQAESDLAAKQAAFVDAQKETHRIDALASSGTVSQAQHDAQTATLKQARAAVAAAKSAVESVQATRGQPGDANALIRSALAQLEQAKLNLANTTIRAQVDGYVGKIDARPGSLATAGMEMMQLVETGEWWVDANFKESALTRIKPGQTATVTIDMVPGQSFTGQVIALSPASGTSFSLFPPENATGNWVKVTQRFPVRVQLKPNGNAAQLRVGASATVTIDTTG